jgi:thiamine biosynthesis lipoprotein
MGMTVLVEIADPTATRADVDAVYDYFHYIDEKFSTYKETSEITQINRGLLAASQFSSDMKTVLRLCAETKEATKGFFDIANKSEMLDPSGLVKGWAIHNAAEIIKKRGFKNYYVDAGGDVQVSGVNAEGQPWRIGIQDPFSKDQKIVKVVSLEDGGVATSGTYVRGQHIYNPHDKKAEINDIVSLTVIGPNIYEADRFATAAFAMGRQGIQFIERCDGLEGYMIDRAGIATQTGGFKKYVHA